MILPPRDATDAFMTAAGLTMNVAFDVDLGQIVRGHHVVARGIDLGHSVPVRRYEKEADNWALDAVPATGGPTLRSRRLSPEDMEVVGTRQTEPELHYEFVPGLQRDEVDADPFFWYWTLRVRDDLGTTYRRDDTGAYGTSGGAASHATRDLGGSVPDGASWLFLRFSPPPDWEPPDGYLNELVVELVERRLIDW